jgi:hypothetical protein
MERALAETRERHAHGLANEQSTSTENAAQNAIQEETDDKNAAIA